MSDAELEKLALKISLELIGAPGSERVATVLAALKSVRDAQPPPRATGTP